MRKAIFWIHLVVGVVAGLVILVMSITGVLLMYQRQITSWADGISVQPPSGTDSRLPVESLWKKVAETEPDRPTTIAISSDPTEAARFSFGREKTLFVDPYTGAILGEGSKGVRAFFRTMIEWHRWLGMAGEKRAIGKAITGASNLGFLFLVVSGFYLWWPRTWSRRSFRAAAFFDRSLSGKARDWNWHNVIGFWSAIPLAIVVFTAVFFSYPWATEWLYRATGEKPPAPRSPSSSAARNSPPKERPDKPDPVAGIAGQNQLWAQAEEKVAGWRTISLRLPSSPNGPLAFTIDRGNGARPDLRAQLTLNAKTGAVEKWEPYESYSLARQIRFWVRWVHTGEAGGWIGQTIAGAVSAAGVLLVWTGLSLAIRRFFKSRKNIAAEVSRPAEVFVE